MSYEPKDVCIWCRAPRIGGGWHPECKEKHKAILDDFAVKRARREAAMTAEQLHDALPLSMRPPGPTKCRVRSCENLLKDGSRDYCDDHYESRTAQDEAVTRGMAKLTGWCPECRGTGHAKRADGRWDLDDVCATCWGSGKAA